MRNDNVFIDQKSNTPFQEEEIYVFDIDNSKYITQFLQFQKSSQISKGKEKLSDCLRKKKNSSKTSHKLEFSQKQNESLDRTSSIYHNYQKHLVTTLKNMITLEKLGQSPESFQLQKKIWNCFLKGTRMNKTLVALTLISFDFANQSEKQTRKTIRKYGFQKISKTYSRQDIANAQKNLREVVFCELRKINFNEELEKRKIKNKDDFKIYFQNFLSELEAGYLHKRMAVQKRQKSQSGSQDSNQMDEQQPQKYQ